MCEQEFNFNEFIREHESGRYCCLLFDYRSTVKQCCNVF